MTERPSYANQIATLTLDGAHAHIRVEAVADGEWREPRLTLAFARWLTAPPPSGADALPSRTAERERVALRRGVRRLVLARR